eukprot:9085911-Alexandrium_andersonii.AAC.1
MPRPVVGSAVRPLAAPRARFGNTGFGEGLPLYGAVTLARRPVPRGACWRRTQLPPAVAVAVPPTSRAPRWLRRATLWRHPFR